MRIFACVLLVTLLQSSYSATIQRNKRWSVNSPDYVMAPGSEPLKLDDPRRQKMTETFSDGSQGLTVIKDPSDGIKACFITDLDPEFSLSTLEKLEIADAQEPLIINNPMKFRDFQNKAGPMISTLCSRLHIFWLNEQLPAPLPLKPLGLSQNAKAPPSLVKAPSSFIRTPPPLHLANHNDVETVKAPGALPPHAMKTPPPLHPAMKVPPGFQHVMKTPPPLHKEIKTPPPL